MFVNNEQISYLSEDVGCLALRTIIACNLFYIDEEGYICFTANAAEQVGQTLIERFKITDVSSSVNV